MDFTRILTADEAERVIAALDSPRNRLLGLLFLDAGLRVGEAVQLRQGNLWLPPDPLIAIDLPADYCKRCRGRHVPLTDRLQNAIADCTAHL